MTQYCATCGTPADPVTGVCPQCAPATVHPAYQQQPAYQQPGFAQPGYQQPMTTAPLPFYAAPPASRFSGQWNWGAFLLNPFWLMNHGQVGLGVGVLILAFIPGISLLTLVSSIYYGIKGNDIAMRYRTFTDEAQFVAVQNAWRNWGIGIALLGIVLMIASFVLIFVGAVIAGSHGS